MKKSKNITRVTAGLALAAPMLAACSSPHETVRYCDDRVIAESLITEESYPGQYEEFLSGLPGELSQLQERNYQDIMQIDDDIVVIADRLTGGIGSNAVTIAVDNGYVERSSDSEDKEITLLRKLGQGCVAYTIDIISFEYNAVSMIVRFGSEAYGFAIRDGVVTNIDGSELSAEDVEGIADTGRATDDLNNLVPIPSDNQNLDEFPESTMPDTIDA